MIVVILFAQLATTRPSAIDSVYSSPAVREVVAAAAAENSRLAEVIPAYRARVESELGMVMQDSIDRETTLGGQQYASTVQWRDGAFDVRVTSARPPSRLPESPAWPGPAWLIPALYGDRLPFIFFRRADPPDRKSKERRIVLDTIAVEHPFERERDRRYRFSGGDTSATIHVTGRTIPIVHIHVVPRFTPDEDGAAFEGDIYLDAARHQIVRLRGRFVRFLRAGSGGARFMRVTASTIAPYVEVTNEEVGGQFWLPHTERVELQLASATLLGERGIWRFTATFTDHVVDTTGMLPAEDRVKTDPRAVVTYVSDDSLGLPHTWHSPLGAATHAVQGSDFNDVAPPNWRDSGPAQFSLVPSRLSRLVHADPVEGLFTGLEGTLNFRDLAPGLNLRAFGGWAWSEQTMRGGGSVTWRRDERAVALHAERSLETTNDFPTDLSVTDPGIAELVGFAQRRDYVDRETAALFWSDIRRSLGDAIVSAQVGVGRDRSEHSRLLRYPFLPSRDTLPPNRVAANGSYARLALDYEFHPDLSVRSTLSGVGARLHYEAANGQLGWQRATIGIAHREVRGSLRFGERVDAGMVASRHALPPQQLFELGGSERLSGYSYKQFAGDRAALASGGANYAFPMLRMMRIPGNLRKLPPLAPGIGASIEMGWTALSNNAARAAVLALGDPPSSVPLSVTTDGLRGSGGIGLTLFSGLLHFGFARSFDSGAKWRSSVGFGSMY